MSPLNTQGAAALAAAAAQQGNTSLHFTRVPPAPGVRRESRIEPRMPARRDCVAVPGRGRVPPFPRAVPPQAVGSAGVPAVYFPANRVPGSVPSSGFVVSQGVPVALAPAVIPSRGGGL